MIRMRLALALLRKTVRLTRTDYRRFGIPWFLVLYAHRNGSPVSKNEAPGWRHYLLICGVQVSTRWGSAQVQWRGFGV